MSTDFEAGELAITLIWKDNKLDYIYNFERYTIMNFTAIFSLAAILGQAVIKLQNPVILAHISSLVLAGVTLAEAVENDNTPDNKKVSAISFINKGIISANDLFLNLTSEQVKWINETLIPQLIDLIYGVCKFLGYFKSNKQVPVNANT